MKATDEKEVTWREIAVSFWAVILLVMSMITLIMAINAYFFEQDTAHAALYLALSVWFEVRAERYNSKEK